MFKKKNMLALIVVAILAFSTIGAYGKETTDSPLAPRPEIGDIGLGPFFEARMEKMIERIEIGLQNRVDQFNERQSTISEKTNLRLERMADIAPDLVADYQAAFDEHNDVHLTLFNTSFGILQSYEYETIAQANTLKEELLAQVAAETLTYKEAMDALKAYILSRRNDFKVNRDAYLAEIQPLVDADAVANSAAQPLREELKLAIEAEDYELSASILSELLEVLYTHIDFDYAKLAILSTYSSSTPL